MHRFYWPDTAVISLLFFRYWFSSSLASSRIIPHHAPAFSRRLMVARVWSFLSYLCPSCLVSCLGSSLIVELFHFQLKSYKVKKWQSWNGGFIVKLKLVPICKMSLSARATCARAHEKEQHPKSPPACKTLCKCSVCLLSNACKRNTVKLRVFEHECIRPFSVGGPHGYKRYP